jgi:hypothetical protein
VPKARISADTDCMCRRARALSGGAPAPGAKGGGTFTYTYYLCPWAPTSQGDVVRCRSHARVRVREDHITTAISCFPDKYVLGHDRTDDHVLAR